MPAPITTACLPITACATLPLNDPPIKAVRARKEVLSCKKWRKAAHFKKKWTNGAAHEASQLAHGSGGSRCERLGSSK